MRAKRITTSVGAILGTMILLAACSTGTESGEQSASGGVINIGVSADLIDTIPSDISQLNSNSIIHHLYDTLVAESASGVDPDPRIARSWTMSPDGLEYVLELRDDVQFHDGSALTSADVVWTLEYARESAVTKGDLSNVESVTAVDDTTVVIKLTEPRPDFLMGLTHPRFGIMPEDFGGVGSEAFKANPVGSGPFKWESHTPGTDIVYARFDDYWAGPASLAGVHFKVFNDVNAEAVALQVGDIDLAENVSLDSVELMPGTPVTQTAPNITEIVQINANSEPLQNADLRRAMSLAIDREDIASSLLSGFGEPSGSILSASSFPEGIPAIENSPYNFDPQEAERLVDASGYAGQPLSLIYSTGIPTDIAVAQALQAMLGDVGIQIELRPLESAAWFKAITTPRPHNEFDLSVSRADGFTPTPQLSFILSREWYAGGWPVDDVEATLKAFGNAADVAAQQEALASFENAAAQSLKSIPIFDAYVVSVLSDQVVGFEPNRTQFYSLTDVTLAG